MEEIIQKSNLLNTMPVNQVWYYSFILYSMPRFVRLVVLILIPVLLQAQPDVSDEETLFNFISSCDGCHIVLEMPIDSVVEYKLEEKEFLAKMFISKEDIRIDSFKLKVGARGNFRRKECAFPPLRLNFSKSALRDLRWETFDQYKLVTHCTFHTYSEVVLMKEFLVYQLYEALTGLSFRTHLFPISYVDTDSGYHMESLAFIIENSTELSQRLRREKCDCPETPPEALDASQVELVSLFQYMIGNRDISLEKAHNVYILAEKGARKRVPVPYDFDFSRFVDAPYVFASSGSSPKRVYLGYEANQRLMPRVISKIRAKRKEFTEIISSFEMLPEEERERSIRYLDEFYQDLEDRQYQLEYIR